MITSRDGNDSYLHIIAPPYDLPLMFSCPWQLSDTSLKGKCCYNCAVASKLHSTSRNKAVIPSQRWAHWFLPLFCFIFEHNQLSLFFASPPFQYSISQVLTTEGGRSLETITSNSATANPLVVQILIFADVQKLCSILASWLLYYTTII